MSTIEDVLTQHGGRFNGAAGPVRSVASRTCDLLPTAAHVAELLHPGIDFGDRISRLVIRLTHGISAKAVELARHAGSSLGRGDYARLVQQELCDHETLAAASDNVILACVDNNPSLLRVVRKAAKDMKAQQSQHVGTQTAVLEPYEA